MVSEPNSSAVLHTEAANDFLLLTEQVLERNRIERNTLLEEPLTQLVRRFIVEWRECYPEDSERAARFLSAITLLLEWKASLLLPVQRTSSDEEEFSPLELELLDLEPFRQIALLLASRHEEQGRMLRREPLPPGALQVEVEDPLLRIKLDDLQNAFQRIVRKLLAEIEQEQMQVRGDKVSRQECQSWLEQLLQDNGTLRLEQLFRLCPRWRAYWVVVFLLLLEQIHQRRVNIIIHEENDIWISWIG